MFRFLKSIFSSWKLQVVDTDDMKKFLIIGLGNIGAEYAETRHNIGFKVLDALASKKDFVFNTARLGDLGSFKVKGRTIICLKPSTYMNLSGKALKYWMDKENISLENVMVIADDLNLPFGSFRIKTKGSDGGHNGLKDIQSTLQSNEYNRFRFGIGADFSKGKQVNYVLGEWSEEEISLLSERLEKSTEIITSFVLSGIQITMNQFNNT